MNQYNPSKINFRTRISSALKIPNIKKKTKGISPSDYPDHLVVNSPKPVGTVVEPSLTSRIYDSQRSARVPLREPAGFPTNRNFSQRLIYLFEEDVPPLPSTFPQRSTQRPRHEQHRLSMPVSPSTSQLAHRSPRTPHPRNSRHEPRVEASSPVRLYLTPGSVTTTTSPSSLTPPSAVTSIQTPQNASYLQVPDHHHPVASSSADPPVPNPYHDHRGPGTDVWAGIEFLNQLVQRKGPGLDEFDSLLDVESLLEPFEFSTS